VLFNTSLRVRATRGSTSVMIASYREIHLSGLLVVY